MIPPFCLYKWNHHKHLTITQQIIWQLGIFADLLCQQKVYLPTRKDSCICNNQQPLTHQLITSVSYYLLCMISVLMKLLWCGSVTGQDKQIRKQKGFRVTQNVSVLSHRELKLGPPKGYRIFPSAASSQYSFPLASLRAKQLKTLQKFSSLMLLPPYQELLAIELLEIN